MSKKSVSAERYEREVAKRMRAEQELLAIRGRETAAAIAKDAAEAAARTAPPPAAEPPPPPPKDPATAAYDEYRRLRSIDVVAARLFALSNSQLLSQAIEKDRK